MTLGTQQEQAFAQVREWYRLACQGRADQVFRLFGYAGTGKTWMAKLIDNELTGGQAQAMAPTAKAASVLREKGLANADTIHAQIYNPKEKSKQRLRDLEALAARAIADRERPQNVDKRRMFDSQISKLEDEIAEEKKKLLRPIWGVNPEAPVKDRPLIILDEVSMVDERVATDIMSFGVPILALGDPAQLPPVGGVGYFTNCKPDVMLTEIHRQAKDNPIIHLATIIREGGSLRPGRYGESVVMPKSGLTPQTVTDADQLLVGRNVTRRSCNNRFRQLRGLYERSAFPFAGERLVCLRNDRETGIYNGVVYITTEEHLDAGGPHITLTLQNEMGQTFMIDAHRAHFLGEEIPFYERKEAQEFDYGYAMTVHKFQGSQADDICLFDEWFRPDSRQQWLYTGITRAAKRITIVQF